MARSRVSSSSNMEAWSVAELGSFYLEKRSELHAHALRILKDPARSEEVVQDVLLKVILAAPELKSSEHALSYMHRSIENLCIDIFRMEGRRPRMVLLDDLNAEVEAQWQIDANHEDAICAANDAAIVRQALSLLSPAERAAIVMWEMEGRSSKEIAKELGIKESTVRHTVSRARASLRRIIMEFIIDESRGLTAYELLSKTYKKSAKIVKDSAKLSLSLILIAFAFLGFNSMTSVLDSPVVESGVLLPQTEFNFLKSGEELEKKSVSKSASSRVEASSAKTSGPNVKSTKLRFPGLDKNGTPVGFTVSDETGILGSAYFRERSPLLSEADSTIGQILKTESGAANVFISQALTADDKGLSYRPTVSFGQGGHWIPLATRVLSTEVNRQEGGNYLVTARIAVDSVVDSPIKVVAKAGGRDLDEAPNQVVTRLVLDSTKTQVLAQAVYVIEKGA